MHDFLSELNQISRSKEEVIKAQQQEYEEKIYHDMMPSKELLNDFDENFLLNLKSVIKSKAFMGDYTELQNGKKLISGQFHLIKKLTEDALGLTHFNGIKFDNDKRKMEAPFETNMIAYEPATLKAKFKSEKKGYKIYANTIMAKHIIKILSEEGIKIEKIENMPSDSDFITEKEFRKYYINRTIIFHYQVVY